MNKALLFIGCWIASLCTSFGFSNNNYAFLSTAATVSAIQDDDERAAAEWFIANYPTGAFITTSDITDETNLSNFSVIWIHIDNKQSSDIPNDFTSTTVLSVIKKYYKGGGNLLLSGYATQYLTDLQRTMRMPNIIGANTGDGELNSDIWAINANIGMTYNYFSHPIYSKVTISEPETIDSRYDYPLIALLSGTLKENHNCMWDLNGFGYSKNVVDAFEEENNANVLATWGQVTDYCCGGIVEFLPTSDYLGSCIAIGVAAYEWNVNGGTNAYLDNIKKLTEGVFDYFSTDPATFTWGGRNGTAWTDPANWWTKNRNHNAASNRAPNSASDVVVIPKLATYKITNYPVVPAEGVEISTITFQPGAEIGNQNYLIHDAATVQFELSETGRWHMLTMPVGASLSDFQFNRDPKIWLLKFIPEGVNANWTYITQSAELAIGEGFAVSVDQNRTEDFPINVTGKLLTNLEASNYPVTLTFGEDNNSAFALVGNPFMTSIDFKKLYNYAQNSEKIKKNYLVWTICDNGYQGFAGYAYDNESFGIVPTDNISAMSNAQFIAPLQAFFVERKNETAGGNLIFDLSQADLSQGKLRANTSDDYAKLDIIAENGTVPVKTFIANKEGAESALKLKDGCGDIPDIYSLNESKATAFGAQIIHTNETTIPLGIATKNKGSMSLTFSGMTSYGDTEIKLIDHEADKTTLLTGDSFRYDFEYTPRTDANGNVTENESRFELVFSPKNSTNIEEYTTGSDVSVYVKNDVIYVKGSPDNQLLQIAVYDLRGSLLYADGNLNTSQFSVTGLPFDNMNICLVKVITEKGVKNVKVINK